MRISHYAVLAAGFFALVPLGIAQAPAEGNRTIANGGITVAGWMGKLDPKDEAAGQKVSDAKLAPEGAGGMHVTTGPAVTYYNPANKASGDYTVKASFNEPKYMNLNDHPHPYGIMIGGNDVGTAQQTGLYCAAYGNGNFIVRGFGPAPFNMNGRGGPNEAVHKAEAKDKPVSQDIAIQVKGDSVSCIINGATVATYSKADLVTAGKLKSTDGIYGLRFAHNTEVIVTGFTMTKN